MEHDNILSRIVEQSRAADVFLTPEILSSVISIVPCIPRPFMALLDPILPALEGTSVPGGNGRTVL